MIKMNCVSGSEIKEVFLIHKDFTIDGLLEYEEQCSSSSISSRVLEITNEDHNDHINYQPVCSEWQMESVLF